MENNNEIHEKFTDGKRERCVRILMLILGTVIVLLLAMTVETGKLYAQALSFGFKGALVRVITPNSDGKNDTAIFCFENPKASAVSARIFDLRGQVVSGMVHVNLPTPPAGGTQGSCNAKFPSVGGLNGLSAPQAVTWDGRANGKAVSPGVYIYQIKAEAVTVTGTVVVVR